MFQTPFRRKVLVLGGDFNEEAEHSQMWDGFIREIERKVNLVSTESTKTWVAP